MYKLAIVVVLALIFFSHESFAKKKKGYSDPCDNAYEELPKVDDNPIFFPEYQSFYNKNKKCIFAGLAEETSSRTVLSLHANWKQLDQLIAISKKDPKFLDFFLKSYNITVNQYEKEAIATLKKAKKCSKDQKDFCKQLHDVIKNALTDYNQPKK
ncbi:MAG: hypothetical protein ACK4VO_09975 [Pseudobdellovibrio sp.]